VNSPGEALLPGWAIYDTMRFVNGRGYLLAWARPPSMARFIMAGTKGKRYTCQIPYHDPSALGGVQGTAEDHLDQAKEILSCVNVNQI